MELQAGSHRSKLRIAHEACAVSSMFSPEALRYKDLNGFIEHFDAIIAEEFFSLGVHRDDLAFLADNHNAVRRGLDYGPVNGIAHCSCVYRHGLP